MIPDLPKEFSLPVKIGSGKYGSVFRVYQEALNRFVAVKVIREKNSAFRANLKQEAVTQATLNLPGIPEIYDVRESASNLFIVMKWVNGCNLSSLLEKRLSIDDCYALAGEIIRIIAGLHKRGYVHRDIKPENIIVSKEGVFLIDFGFSGIPNNTDLTIKGTPLYIAPELAEGKQHDADLMCADVYSLGKLIHELLGNQNVPDCIDDALLKNPLFRIKSAEELLTAWNEQVQQKQVDWEAVSQPETDRILSEQLIASARLMLGRKKIEDAYKLVIECLKLDPDSADALHVIEQIPVLRKKGNRSNSKKILLTLILFAGAGICAVLFTGKKMIGTSLNQAHKTFDYPLVVPSMNKEPSMIDVSFPVKDEIMSKQWLTGTLIIKQKNSTGTLTIDNETTFVNSNITVSIPARYHNVVWCNQDEEIKWKEQVVVHPFEEKKISIKDK